MTHTNNTHNTKSISPLRQRMTDDMTMRKLAPVSASVQARLFAAVFSWKKEGVRIQRPNKFNLTQKPTMILRGQMLCDL